MRALLVVNPTATTTSVRGRDVLARALGSELKLDVAETEHRGHAIELGHRATREGYDLVVVLGGDGTVNEVVNGLLREHGDRPQTEQPALAVVPGGSTNVFHRTLGVATDPVEATSELIDALRARRSRWISLGRMSGEPVGERWFTFTAGLGLDAAAVQRVEEARSAGRNPTPLRYAATAVGRFFHGSDRRHPAITLEQPGHDPVDGLFLAIVSNSTPWTYFGARPVVLTPTASHDTGLDLVAMRRLRVLGTIWATSGMLSGRGIRGRAALVLPDQREFTLTMTRPLPLQADGDFLGETTRVRFTSAPAALQVLG